MKAFFLKCALREKALLLAFALLALAIAGGHALRRGAALWQDWRAARGEFVAQQLWLDHADAIAAQATAATRSLDPAQTLNATRLVGELSALASQSGLTADIGTQRTEEGTGQFAFHAVQVNFRRAELGALLRFYSALSARAPYMALEQFSIAADRANPGSLNVSLRVVSVELAR
jgi:hypothetical protein